MPAIAIIASLAATGSVVLLGVLLFLFVNGLPDDGLPGEDTLPGLVPAAPTGLRGDGGPRRKRATWMPR